MSNDIAVIGMGCVFPGAEDVDQYWSNNVNGVDAITEIPKQRWPNVDFSRLPDGHDTRMTCTRGGFLGNMTSIDARRHGIMPNVIKSGDPDQFLMIHVADEALRDAGVGADDPVREHTDVIIGRGGYMSVTMADTFLRVDLLSRIMPFLQLRFPDLSRRELAELHDELHATLPPCEPESYVSCIPNLVASRVCNRLDLRGSAYVVDAACASSLIAVEHAVERLRNGLCNLALAAGIHLCQHPPFWYVFTHLGALSASGVCRPFDRRADGLLLGEGAGALVLKRAEDAFSDGDRVYAVIKGVGSASDGRRTGILTPLPDGQLRALERAYADADVDRHSISYLETHGTATTAGDPAEIETIRRFYGTCDTPGRVMGSVKSMIGHAMPAAGMAGMIRTILALSNKVLPPTLNCEEPRKELEDAAFYLPDEARTWAYPRGQPRRAGVNCFGFGGINAHVVLEEVPEQNPVLAGVPGSRPIQVASNRAAEPILLAAESREDLVEKLKQLVTFLEEDASGHRLEDVAYSLTREIDFSRPCKLALVCKDLDELKQKLADCIARLEAGKEPDSRDEDVYFSKNASTPLGKVTFCFPGLAFPGLVGNCPQHMLQLCLHFPELRAALDLFEGKDGHPDDPIPFSCALSPPKSYSVEQREFLKQRIAPPKALREEEEAQAIQPGERNLSGVGTTLSNWLGFKLLDGLSISRDMVCGTSAGDLAALAAAGVVDMERDMVPGLWEGFNTQSSHFSRGCMGFVGTSLDKLKPYLVDKPNTQLAVDISHKAVLVGGDFDEIDRLCVQLSKDNVTGIRLPYLPGHTPRMSYLREVVYDVEHEKVLGPPQLPIYSAISVDLFPSDAAGILELLTANLDQPVRFWQVHRRLYEDGARVFLQAGSGTVASNVDTLLEADDVASASVDVESRDPITQLAHLMGVVFTAGVRFDPQFVYKHRRPRLLKIDEPQSAADVGKGQVELQLSWCFYSPDVPEAAESGDALAVADEAKPQAAEDVEETVASQIPFVVDVLRFVPQEEILVRKTLDLAEDLYLHDHHFINASSVKPMEECLPVFPMVMTMEAMAEAAAHLAPGLGLIGFEDIKASRWITLNESTRSEIRVEAKLRQVDETTGVHTVEVRIITEGHTAASATVLLAAEYPYDVELAFPELENPEPWPITARELYDDGHTFHGPRFRTVSGLDVLAENGFEARLTMLPKDGLFASMPDVELLTDPAVIDGAGQLFGGWAQTRGGYVLPVGVDKVEIFGPTPPPGTEVAIRMAATQFDLDNDVAAGDMEILDGEGNVWMQIRGWRDRIFVKSNKFMDVQRLPGRLSLSELSQLPGLPDDAVCAELNAEDLLSGSLTWVCKLHLTAEELDTLQSQLGPRRRQFLLGRIAAKDAVRAWLARESGREMIHPAAVVIGNRESGQPYVEPIPGVDVLPEISISHTDGKAVAVASSSPVGVDVEPLSRDTERILTEFARKEEVEIIRRLSAQQPQEAWPTRLWCAKESVGKSLGLGLGGQIHDFELVDAADDGVLRILYRPSDRELIASTIRLDTAIVASSWLEPARAAGA